MEMIDVLDENGVLTGEVATRAEVHRLGLWQMVESGAMVDRPAIWPLLAQNVGGGAI